VARARQALDAPKFNFHCLNADGDWVFAFDHDVRGSDSAARGVAAGAQVRIIAELDNPLVPGRYTFQCWISRLQERGGMAIHILRLVDFFVYGTRPGAGSVAISGEVDVVIERS
jgi:hypothetical protein